MNVTDLDDEVEDLKMLLLEHASITFPPSPQLIERMAHAALQPNHLWEDLGLRNRDELQDLMRHHFPSLKAMNHGNMRWKKFLYRLLCERAEVLICKSPSCERCSDQPVCFGPE
jgi:nitrogen fixation protein NifQ